MVDAPRRALYREASIPTLEDRPLLDIKWIRENHDAFVKGLADRGSPEPGETLNQILKLDEQRRATIHKLQEAQARRNAASREIGQAKAAKDDARAKALMDEVGTA